VAASSLVLGCNGPVRSGRIADLQAALYQAVKATTWRGQTQDPPIYPLAQVSTRTVRRYAQRARPARTHPVRRRPPPLAKLSDAEITRIRTALAEAKIERKRVAAGGLSVLRTKPFRVEPLRLHPFIPQPFVLSVGSEVGVKG
jgi:hypothetical protein